MSVWRNWLAIFGNTFFSDFDPPQWPTVSHGIESPWSTLIHCRPARRAVPSTKCVPQDECGKWPSPIRDLHHEHTHYAVSIPVPNMFKVACLAHRPSSCRSMSMSTRLRLSCRARVSLLENLGCFVKQMYFVVFCGVLKSFAGVLWCFAGVLRVFCECFAVFLQNTQNARKTSKNTGITQKTHNTKYNTNTLMYCGRFPRTVNFDCIAQNSFHKTSAKHRKTPQNTAKQSQDAFCGITSQNTAKRKQNAQKRRNTLGLTRNTLELCRESTQYAIWI